MLQSVNFSDIDRGRYRIPTKPIFGPSPTYDTHTLTFVREAAHSSHSIDSCLCRRHIEMGRGVVLTTYCSILTKCSVTHHGAVGTGIPDRG